MCTLSYIPKKYSGFLLSSNRDEKVSRKSALAPAIYNHGKVQVLYPKDGQAGGTWLATSDNGYTLCLLNGAFVRHFPEPPYRRSRGLVLLDFFNYNDVDLFADLYDFYGIEPFTLVVVCEQRVINEMRWDGTKLHRKSLDPTVPHIWSSATLYDPEVVIERQNWFKQFLDLAPEPDVKDMLHFHHFGGNGDEKVSLKMNRNNGLQTISISCVEHSGSEVNFHHEDLLTSHISTITLKSKIHV
jgi:hypothetical protein